MPFLYPLICIVYKPCSPKNKNFLLRVLLLDEACELSHWKSFLSLFLQCVWLPPFHQSLFIALILDRISSHSKCFCLGSSCSLAFFPNSKCFFFGQAVFSSKKGISELAADYQSVMAEVSNL
ncbi:hypothetical protein V6N11_014071 [Hibiscus sabdariffa]|uniref:Uncharacterized protein n=1 Tax=Hibiscus sabdariffa TaxID=183260 RepID=A0ABR2AFK4_9ROSI